MRSDHHYGRMDRNMSDWLIRRPGYMDIQEFI